jgi:rhamnose utilization protein RhaD (predicted bifunctional aldolase and dehydrogenase)
VLHGGGNTSVKTTVTNIFGEKENILYVKGSGWDLATIKSEGFAPVKMDILLKMAKLKSLSDTDMVKYQRMAMVEPLAPNPSVEAILHAIIPFKYVDHTHSDAIVTITNTKNPKAKIKKIYGKNMLIIPYIMPGFVLAKLVYDMTKNINWDKLDGMILLNHGLFTFDNDAKKSYEKTIKLVDKAEKYL